MNGVILVGFMGSGKSTVAQTLSQQISLPLIDLDQLIETTANQTIPDIFAQQGETGFRKIETACLRQVINQPVIVATGGGVVLSQENRQLLQKTASLVVWLKADFETYYTRIMNDQQTIRPIVHQNSKVDLAKIERTRRVYYEEVADVVMDVSDLTINQIVHQIKRSIVK